MRRPVMGLWTAALLAAVSAAGLGWESLGDRRGSPEGSPALLRVPDFELTDQQGRLVRRADLGGPWIADFIFTRCAGQCPLMTERMKKLSGRLPGVRLVSLSVDPEDAPAALRRHRRETGADWLFLTGAPGEVRRLSVEGFKLAAAEGGPAREPFLHSKRLALVDAEGRLRGTFDSDDEAAVAELVRRARSLKRNRTFPEAALPRLPAPRPLRAP